ncbi:uncharacterized protein B0I36DRAFT_345082 [Microdochium trichocladiopsis]|uniref:SnoaL-like domain-containing protein n=1 Tax=Microdochium trichocladiopsis TaxID=1682393 RepID=A0A9P8YM24_9PEZI|nr:uncharacterized protein B0I36DRAFT_345082 [Microdochium trichocladiopsis]KAH7041485.1 hypothetical protein B0I36DRAFT_345082 [Microdochium trichocladiopsis]
MMSFYFSALAALAVVATASPLPSTSTPAVPIPSLPACPPIFLHKEGALSLPVVARIFAEISTAPFSGAGSASDIEQIRQTIARYPLAVDSRDFDVLDTVFAPDVSANYSSVGVMHGVEAVKEEIAATVSVFTHTQHHTGTSAIQLCRDQGDEVAAISATYTMSNNFISPDGAFPAVVPLDGGSVSFVYAMYQDIWVRTADDCDDSGEAPVQWRIRDRAVLFLAISFPTLANFVLLWQFADHYWHRDLLRAHYLMAYCKSWERLAV